MALDLENSSTDRVRFRLGDTLEPYVLDDTSIAYYVTKNNDNENRAYRELLTILLFALSRFTRERCADIEVYGSERFRQYYDAVKLAISNPSLQAIPATPYAGGISRQEMYENDQDTDTVDKRFFMGITDDCPAYLTKTLYD